MKRVLLSLILLIVVAFVMIGADIRPTPTGEIVVKKHCVGYTVIEAGKGLDCHGDTVALIRKQGFYELASRTNKLVLDHVPTLEE